MFELAVIWDVLPRRKCETIQVRGLQEENLLRFKGRARGNWFDEPGKFACINLIASTWCPSFSGFYAFRFVEKILALGPHGFDCVRIIRQS